MEKPLTATAMALETENDQMIMVSCDLAGITTELLASVREALKYNTAGIDPQKIIMCAIHTHTSLRCFKACR